MPHVFDDMMKTLDLVERKVGKRRRDAISNELPDMSEEGGITSWSMTTWQLFLALTRFSSVEKNINAKKDIDFLKDNSSGFNIKNAVMLENW